MDINQEDVIVDAKIIESSDVKPSNTKTEKAKSEQSLGEIKDQIKADIKDIAKQLSLAAKYFAYSKKIKKEKADFIKSVKEEAPEVEVEYLQPETPEKKSQKRDGIDIVMGGVPEAFEKSSVGNVATKSEAALENNNKTNALPGHTPAALENTKKSTALQAFEKKYEIKQRAAINGIKRHLESASSKTADLLLLPETKKIENLLPVATFVDQSNKFDLAPADFKKEVASTVEKENKVLPLVEAVKENPKEYFPIVTNENTKFKQGLPIDPVVLFIDDLAKSFTNNFVVPQPNFINFGIMNPMQTFFNAIPDHSQDFKMSFDNKQMKFDMKRNGDDVSIKLKEKGDSIGAAIMKSLGDGLESWIGQQRGFMWSFSKALRDNLRQRKATSVTKINAKVNNPYLIPLTNRNLNIYENYMNQQQQFIQDLYKVTMAREFIAMKQKDSILQQTNKIEPQQKKQTKDIDR